MCWEVGRAELQTWEPQLLGSVTVSKGFCLCSPDASGWQELSSPLSEHGFESYKKHTELRGCTRLKTCPSYFTQEPWGVRVCGGAFGLQVLETLHNLQGCYYSWGCGDCNRRPSKKGLCTWGNRWWHFGALRGVNEATLSPVPSAPSNLGK